MATATELGEYLVVGCFDSLKCQSSPRPSTQDPGESGLRDEETTDISG